MKYKGLVLSVLVCGCVSLPQASSLVGGWALGPPPCETDTGFSLEADGTYQDLDSTGVWSLAGDQLTIRITGGDDLGQHVMRVRASRSAEVVLEWPNGSLAKYHRCS